MTSFINEAMFRVLCITLIRTGAAFTVSGASLGHTHQLSSLHIPSTSSSSSSSDNTTDGRTQVLTHETKPIRIHRIGPNSSTGPDPAGSSTRRCGFDGPKKAGASADKEARCPDDCPFFVQDRLDDDFCTFACVTEAECAMFYPKTPIGDLEKGVCRSCIVDQCNVCDFSVVEDRCAECSMGYFLGVDGKCHFMYKQASIGIAVVLGVVACLVLFWLLDFGCRNSVNERGLKHAMDFRAGCLVHMARNEQGECKKWPLLTNMFTNPHVAGPGMALHMQFQAALFFWALWIAGVWIAFALGVDEALWILGMRSFGTPRSNCILVAWGYETQERLMWTKIMFLWIAYISTFLMCMVYGVYQLRTFQHFDQQSKTMKDFALMIEDMPIADGKDRVEEDLKSHLVNLTGVEIVGVSVAWDYKEKREEIEAALEHDLRKVLGQPRPGPPVDFSGAWPWRRYLYKIEQRIFGLEFKAEEEGIDLFTPRKEDRDPVETLVQSLKSSARAFVVFQTEEARNEAHRKIGDGFSYKGQSGITLTEITAEPDTVQWENFGHSENYQKILRLLGGFGFIFLACTVWAIVFYGPYAYYTLTFNYENGREPGPAVGMAFTMIVCMGNVIMYEVCNQVSLWVGFRFSDERQSCYLILYTCACMFNVLVDFVVTYFTAEMVLEGLGFRTYFGVPLEDVPTFTEKFDTYGMQRQLAGNTYAYAFPATFLIPFLIEPFATIAMPLFMGKCIVKGHPELQGRDAEAWCMATEMEMGRYSDLLLNMILGVLIFYFPGGYTWMLFLGMAGSSLYIYLFDHWKVLRGVPKCDFASYDIEWYLQAMLCPVVGLICSCLYYKSNCYSNSLMGHCHQGIGLLMWSTLMFFVHTSFQLACLHWVIPRFGLKDLEEDPNEGKTYKEVAEEEACSWFTSNPVHCLRSQHHYDHSPPCSLFELGKEHHIRVNKSIGCFYDGSQLHSLIRDDSDEEHGRSPNSPHSGDA